MTGNDHEPHVEISCKATPECSKYQSAYKGREGIFITMTKKMLKVCISLVTDCSEKNQSPVAHFGMRKNFIFFVLRIVMAVVLLTITLHMQISKKF